MRERARKIVVKNGSGGRVEGSVIRITGATLSVVAGEVVVGISGGGGSSPLTTNGDLYYYNAGDTRLPIGANGRLLMVASGLPAWSSASDVRTALSLVPGTDIQAYNAGLADIAGLSPSRGDIIVRNGSAWTRLPIGAANRILLSDGTDPAWASPADVRTALDLATYYQGADAGLTSLTAADASAGLPYVSGGNTWASATYSGMLSVVSAAWKVVGLRESGGTDLGMGAVADGEVLRRSGTSIVGAAIGVVLQAYNALLAAIAGLGTNGLIVRTSSSTAAARTITAGDGITVADGDGVSGNPTISVQEDVKGFPIYRLFTVIQPQGPVLVNVDGVGATLTSAGVYAVNQSEAGFPCTQYGDASAAAARFYLLGYFRIEAGTVTTDILFKMGSDISAGITVVFIGFSSNASLTAGDPTGHRYTIRWLRGTDTNWQLSTKDNVTQTLVDTGVAVTADYYYAVRFVATSSQVDVQISAAATVAAAKSGIDSAATTSSTTNLPASGNDMYAFFGMQRSAASTNRCLKFGYWRTIQVT